MNGDVPLHSNLRRIPVRRTPWHLRARRRIRRSFRICLAKCKSTRVWRDAILYVAAAAAVALVCSVFSRSIFTRHPFFDDVKDMAEFERNDTELLQRWRNASSIPFTDPTRNFNTTEVKLARATWDYIYGELVRKPTPPVLTKYKKRILRELYQQTKYVYSKKLKGALHVTCNYLNAIEDDVDLTSFQCAHTSHRCLDGIFQPSLAFVPVEGAWATWEDVVLVLIVGADRGEYLTAITETWVGRLHPDATIFLARDNGTPEVPDGLKRRQNVVIYDYPGSQGLEDLDMKAVVTWDVVYKIYRKTGKKYFLKIDDDSLLIGHNLMRFLIKVDRWFSGHEEPLYFGHPFCGHGDLEALGFARWCYAGGGAYGMNTEALSMLVRQVRGGCAYFYDYIAKAPNMRPGSDRYGGRYEDVMVGRCLRQAKNRLQMNGTSLLACGSFFPYAPLHYYEQFGSNAKAMSNKLGNNVITMHNLEPSAIRYLDYFMFEHPIGGRVSPFSTNNPRLESELLQICHMRGKKMWCNWSRPSSLGKLDRNLTRR